MIRSWKRRIAAFGTSITVVVAGMAFAGPARAASTTFDPVDAATTAQFTLTPGSTFSTDATAIQAVESSGAVTVLNANNLLDRTGWSGSVGLCHNTGLASALSPSGFCWDKADDTSDSYTTAGGWTPQGISGSYDAQPTGTWTDGTTQHTAYLASWHFDQGLGGSNPVANEYARVSLVNADNNQINYNNLLLVQPGVDSSGHGDFTATPATHADGIVWYGNSVFVANGRWLQVYSLKHIWQVNSNQDFVGIQSGVSSAHYSNYALPMVGEYYTTASPDTACAVATGTGPCLNSLSLDRTGQDGLVSSEYDGSAGGRVIRWPLNYQTALPLVNDTTGAGTTHATVAYASPVLHMQGATTNGTSWYMAGDCPSGVGTGSGDPSGVPYSCIYKTSPGGTPAVHTTSPVMTQNLGYSPATNRIWGINERINSTTGERVVFSVNP